MGRLEWPNLVINGKKLSKTGTNLENLHHGECVRICVQDIILLCVCLHKSRWQWYIHCSLFILKVNFDPTKLHNFVLRLGFFETWWTKV